MALSRTQVAQQFLFEVTSDWTSGSFSADEDDLIVIVIEWLRATSGTSYANPEWSVSSTGITFTEQISIGGSITIWPTTLEVYTGLVPSTGSRTVTVNASSKKHIGYVTVFKYSGVDTTTPIRQVKQFNVDETTLTNGAYSYNLDSSPLSTSEVLAFVSVDTTGTCYMAPGTGWTELLDAPIDNSSYGEQHIMVRGSSTSTSVSYDDVNVNNTTIYDQWNFGAIEVAAAEAPPSSTGYSFSMIY